MTDIFNAIFRFNCGWCKKRSDTWWKKLAERNEDKLWCKIYYKLTWWETQSKIWRLGVWWHYIFHKTGRIQKFGPQYDPCEDCPLCHPELAQQEN